MQTINRQSTHQIKNHETATMFSRRNSSDLATIAESTFDEMIVEIVSAEYPKSKEEASVLMSKIWCLIEDEIGGDPGQSVADENMKMQIARVSESFNAAVEKLKLLNMPLLRHGAVNEYFSLR